MVANLPLLVQIPSCKSICHKPKQHLEPTNSLDVHGIHLDFSLWPRLVAFVEDRKGPRTESVLQSSSPIMTENISQLMEGLIASNLEVSQQRDFVIDGWIEKASFSSDERASNSVHAVECADVRSLLKLSMRNRIVNTWTVDLRFHLAPGSASRPNLRQKLPVVAVTAPVRSSRAVMLRPHWTIPSRGIEICDVNPFVNKLPTPVKGGL